MAQRGVGPIYAQQAPSTVNGESVQGESVNTGRDLNNSYHFRSNKDAHWNAQVIGGAVWDVRQAIGKTKADRLYTKALELAPHAHTYENYGYNMVIADQNVYSANHESQIRAAFSNHNITIPSLPNLTVSISGPSSLNSGEQGTWQANASGGHGGYNYEWKYKIIYSGCGPTLNGAEINPNDVNECQWTDGGSGSSFSRSVSGDADLQLQVTVTDNVSDEEQASKFVTIGSGATSLSKKDGEKQAVATAAISTLEKFVLKSVAPNPSRSQTTLRYGLPEAADVRLTVYDALGRRVKTLASGSQEAGWHTVQFAAGDLPAGVYLVRMQAGSFAETKRVVLAQ